MRVFFTVCWSVWILHARSQDEFSMSDEDFLNNDLEFIPPTDDFTSFWSNQEPFVQTSMATESLGYEIAACLYGDDDSLGKNRVRSDTCLNDSTDPELEEALKELDWPWKNYDSAIDGENGIRRDDLCPDRIGLGNVLPVCSSGSQNDISWDIAGEVRLQWCALGKLGLLPKALQILTNLEPKSFSAVNPFIYPLCEKPGSLYCCRRYFPLVSSSPNHLSSSAILAVVQICKLLIFFWPVSIVP